MVFAVLHLCIRMLGFGHGPRGKGEAGAMVRTSTMRKIRRQQHRAALEVVSFDCLVLKQLSSVQR
jgi:hypothetical protein